MWNPFSRSNTPAAGKPAHVQLGDRSFDPDGSERQTQHEIAQVEVIGGVAVITVTVEELCSQRGAALLADLLDQVVDMGVAHMVLDIQNVVYMDSACVGCMVEALNKMAQSGGRIALVNPASGVAHIFRITRLDRVFPICSDVLTAIKAVERKSEGEG